MARKRIWMSILGAAILAPSAAGGQSVLEPPRADPFSALVGKRAPRAERADRPRVERYVIATGGGVFLFQPGENQARLQFLCGEGDQGVDCLIDSEVPAEEIYQLTPTRAPRGDIVWRDQDGEARLRIAAYGGATVFSPRDSVGRAAARSYGEDPPLALPEANVETAAARAQKATALVSAQLGAPVIFDIGTPALDETGAASVLADAVARAAKGVSAVGDDPIGARVVAERIGRVEFHGTQAAALRIDDRSLKVGYDPDGGLAGRPSSAAVARFLEEAL